MKPHWYYILLSLAGGQRHGSGIMRDVLDLTEGELKLWPATLYGSLEELEDRGWIEEVSDPAERPEGASDRKRFYRLARLGRHELRAETERLEGVLAAARRRLVEESA